MNKVTCTAILSMVLLSVFFVSCKENVIRGEGEKVVEQRKVSAFNKISIDLASDATIVVGKDYGLQLNAQGNLHEHIKTEVVNKTLKIHHRGMVMTSEGIDLVITVPSLIGLDINGAADANIEGDVKADIFKLAVRGTSDVDIDEMHVNKLDVKISGASDLAVNSGYAAIAGYKITGTGTIEAPRLRSKKVVARISGAGEMSLHVIDSLDARITGTGEINYTGHPQVTSKVTGAGYVNDKNN